MPFMAKFYDAIVFIFRLFDRAVSTAECNEWWEDELLMQCCRSNRVALYG
jgi:hypothetical protein